MTKRILALFLCLVMMFSIVACGTEPEETLTSDTKTEETKEENTDKKTEEKAEETKEEEIVYGKIEKPISPADLAAIPVANSSMTTDELRQICLDFVALQVSFPWISTSTYHYVVPSQQYPVTYKEGTVYAGVPYVNVASGTVYRWLEYYNPETGYVDLSAFFGISADSNKLYGTACSGTACWGWGRVVNSADYSWTANMNAKHGFIPVGDYKYDPETYRYGEDGFLDCKDIAKENGKKVMFESYTKLLPADCLVNNGHVRMCASTPVVVRDENGNIDGAKSYTTFSDQGMYRDLDYQIRTQSDGSTYSIQGSVDVKITFDELYTSGYLPHTFAEFLGTDPVEDTQATLSVSTAGTVSLQEISLAAIEANYAISDVFFKVKDANGNIARKYTARASNHFTYSLNFSSLPLAIFQEFTNGSYTLEISTQLSNGDVPVVCSATLVV